MTWTFAGLLWPPHEVRAAGFPGNVHIEIPDPNGVLSWNTNANKSTVQCWFKLSVPSGVAFPEMMCLLGHPFKTYEEGGFDFSISYVSMATGVRQVVFHASSGKDSGFWLPLIQEPSVERWYHVAVVRDGELVTVYVDGRQMGPFSPNLGQGQPAGDTSGLRGLSIGGVTGESGADFYGEIQELSIYRDALSGNLIRDRMFTDQDTNYPALMGYYKLSHSQKPSDRLRNLADRAQPGTDGTAAGSGVLTYEQTDQKGEQSTFDANQNGGAQALASLSGCFSWEQTVLFRPTPGIPFEFRIGYSSANPNGRHTVGETDPLVAGPMGDRWRHSFETRVIPSRFSPDSSVVSLLMWNGNMETWTNFTNLGGTNYYGTRRGAYRGEFFKVGNELQWITPERLIHTFRLPDDATQAMQGRLTSIQDANHNLLRLEYDANGQLMNVVDTAGAAWSFNYVDSLLKSVTFSDWTAVFEYEAGSQRLLSKTVTNLSGLYSPAANPTMRFTYWWDGRLRSVVDPMGRTALEVTYDEYGRKHTCKNALGQITRVVYNAPQRRQILTLDLEGFSWVSTFDRLGRVVARSDPLGNESRFTYDTAGNLTSATDPMGNLTLFGYDAHGNRIAQTNVLGEISRAQYDLALNKPLTLTDPLGWTTTNVYDRAGNLVTQRDGMGLLVANTFKTNGLLETRTDANGHTITNIYDDLTGFLIAQIDAAGYTNRIVPSELGWPLATINSLGEVTTYRYDIIGSITLTLDALGRGYGAGYDANGNRTSQTDAKWKFTYYDYDVLNRRIRQVDRAGAGTSCGYTPRGQLAWTKDPVGAVTTYSYDAVNREIGVVDALGNKTLKEYNANGNLVTVIDALGGRWTRAYDRLNRNVAQTDPSGSTIQTVFDQAGRPTKSIDPKGGVTTLQYDNRGRLTNRVDAAGSRWQYDYDLAGNLTGITDAKGGRYAMAYDSRNQRVAETNQDGKVWLYTYDAVGRLKTQTEPDGTVRKMEYDAGGRVVAASYMNSGRVNRFEYDLNDNPVMLSRSNAVEVTQTLLDYDIMDRVIGYTDAFALRVSYVYDAAGRITELRYPRGRYLFNTYDALGQITRQDFIFDALRRYTNTYAYDACSRLVHRTYPNGIVQSNTFDNVGELASLSHSALDPQPSTLDAGFFYTHDRNRNTSSCREQGTLQWPTPALRDDVAGFTAGARLVDRTIALKAQSFNHSYHYDDRGNMTNAIRRTGTADIATWLLSYDEDNRTTSIDYDNNLTAKHIVNRYDALGRRVAKTVDGTLTVYVLDLAGGMERILCEYDIYGVTAWYVHGPDLTYKVTPEGTLTCYHSDGQGNIRALTGQGGTNLVQYAYTPYGRCLSSQPLSTDVQPFRFAGSQGVMEEEGIPGLYFMRARYYAAEEGVFLSTDPVRNIGPDWQPIAFAYGNCNPLRYNDPKGEVWNFIVGAVAGGAIDFSMQLAFGHGDLQQRWNSISWSQVSGAALAGALTSGLAGMGSVATGSLLKAAAIKAVYQTAIGAQAGVIGKTAELTGRAVFENGSLDAKDWAAGLGEAAAFGALAGAGEGASSTLFRHKAIKELRSVKSAINRNNAMLSGGFARERGLRASLRGGRVTAARTEARVSSLNNRLAQLNDELNWSSKRAMDWNYDRSDAYEEAAGVFWELGFSTGQGAAHFDWE